MAKSKCELCGKKANGTVACKECGAKFCKKCGDFERDMCEDCNMSEPAEIKEEIDTDEQEYEEED